MQPQVILVLVLALSAIRLCASVEPQAKCGKPAMAPDESGTEQLAGGFKEAVPHSWSWIVSLRLNGSHHCGGSIVNESWVATAAQCVHLSQVSLFSVEAGRHCRDCQEGSVQRRQVARIVIHPEYDSNYTEHDLAMLRVNEPFEFNENVSRICLPTAHLQDSAAACFAAGWGGTAGGNGSDFLRQARLPIVPNLVCGDPDHYGSGGISQAMVCAGYVTEGANFCAGDFGGPLMCKSGETGLWELHGVASAGDSCDKPLRPLVFTRVQEYAAWIIVDAITLAS